MGTEESKQIAYNKLEQLMNATTQICIAGKKSNEPDSRQFSNLYNLETHFFLNKYAKDIMFPLDKSLWGSNFKKLNPSKELS